MAEDKREEPQVRVVDRRWWARGDSGDGSSATTTGAASVKPTYVEELEQRLGDTTAQLQTLANDRRRLMDEFEQVKARMRREAGRDAERARRAVFVELLDVLDNLERALAAAPHQASGDSAPSDAHAARLAQGVGLVRDQFLGKLQAFGVVRVPALGQPFDATRHEAVSTAPVSAPADDGVVVGVVKEGYAVGDDLLRPASVIVGQFAPQ